MSTLNTPVWALDAPALPALTGDAQCDVCVIGLGASGLTAARLAAESGRSVIAIDAATVARGAAGRNGGLLLAGLADFHHDAVRLLGRDDAVRWYRRTLDALEVQFARYPGCTTRTGSLRLAASEAEVDDCRAQYDQLRADDLPVEWYEGREGTGLLLPTDGVMQPMQRAHHMLAEAIAADVRVHAQTPALDVTAHHVSTPHGFIACDRIIVAVDGRLEHLVPELRPRVRTARLQMLATAPDASVSIPRPIYWRDGYEYWQQLSDGRVALGGFRDTALDDEWTADATPTPVLQARLESFLREHVQVTAPITHRWAASVAYTGDGRPVSEEVRPGVYAIGAYSGTGNIVGLLCAEEAVAWAVGRA
jgi:gamma-glutamylputrescine oxidase